MPFLITSCSRGRHEGVPGPSFHNHRFHLYNPLCDSNFRVLKIHGPLIGFPTRPCKLPFPWPHPTKWGTNEIQMVVHLSLHICNTTTIVFLRVVHDRVWIQNYHSILVSRLNRSLEFGFSTPFELGPTRFGGKAVPH